MTVYAREFLQNNASSVRFDETDRARWRTSVLAKGAWMNMSGMGGKIGCWPAIVLLAVVTLLFMAGMVYVAMQVFGNPTP